MSNCAAAETPTPPPTSTSTLLPFLAVATLTPKPRFIEPGLSSRTMGASRVTSSKRDQEQAALFRPTLRRSGYGTASSNQMQEATEATNDASETPPQKQAGTLTRGL